MSWRVELVDAFAEELAALAPEVQDELAVRALLLERFGPALGRPAADTLAR